MPQLTLRLPRHVEAVATACSRAEALLADAGWGGDDTTRALLAVGEAVGNAVEHGRGATSDIAVSFRLGPTAFDVRVDDGGPGPDPATLVAATLPDDPLAIEGRGLYILSHVADALRVEDGSLWLTIRPRP